MFHFSAWRQCAGGLAHWCQGQTTQCSGSWSGIRHIKPNEMTNAVIFGSLLQSNFYNVATSFYGIMMHTETNIKLRLINTVQFLSLLQLILFRKCSQLAETKLPNSGFRWLLFLSGSCVPHSCSFFKDMARFVTITINYITVCFSEHIMVYCQCLKNVVF